MKNLRKMIGMIVSVLMVWATAISVAAATYTIRVDNARPGETYSIYKMMDVSFNAELDSYSYTVADGWESFFTSGGAGSTYTTITNGYVTGLDSSRMEEFGKAASAYVSSASPALSKAASSIIAPESRTFTFQLTSPGYYLITSTGGSLVSISTTPQASEVVVTEKTLMASISLDRTDVEAGKEFAMIGHSMQYLNTITIQKGAVNAVLHLDLSDGMTFEQVDSLMVNNTALTEGTDYTVYENPSADTCDVHIEFSKTWLDSLTSAKIVKASYSLHLNGDASLSPDSETLRTWLSDGTVTSTQVKSASVSTLFFDLVKVESLSGKVLDGAQFELYTAGDQSGVRIDLVKESEGVYHVASPQEKAASGFTSAVIDAGKARIKGFNAWQTVHLQEIKAPDGYNKLPNRYRVNFEEYNIENSMSGNTWTESDGGIGVLNSKGAVLPATGGGGNTFFYMFGGALCMIGGITMLRLSSAGKE